MDLRRDHLLSGTPDVRRPHYIELEERYQEIVDTIKKAAAKKGNDVHDTRNNAKDQVEKENAAPAAEAESTLVEAVAQEIERRSMMRSSTVTDQRGVPTQHEHRRQDGWTSTPRWSDDEKKAVNGTRRQGSDCRINAHTRL